MTTKPNRREFFRTLKNVLLGNDPLMPVLDGHPFRDGEIALDLDTQKYKVWINGGWAPADDLNALLEVQRERDALREEVKAFRQALLLADANLPGGHGSADITYRYGYQKALSRIWEHLEKTGINNKETTRSAV